MEGIDYDPGDYLLIGKDGQIVAVSGNSDFDDIEDFDESSPLAVALVHPHLIVKVLEVAGVDSEGNPIYKYWDYSKEECPEPCCLGK